MGGMNVQEFPLIQRRLLWLRAKELSVGSIRAFVERKVQVQSLLQEWEGALGASQYGKNPDLPQPPIEVILSVLFHESLASL